MSSEVQLTAAPRGSDLEKNSGDIKATVTENGEHPGGVQSAGNDAQERAQESPVTLPVADPGASLGGDEIEPLLSSPAGDIEQGGKYEADNEALLEIENILWIKNLDNTKRNRCKVALELWKEKDKLFTDRIDRKKKQSLDFQNEVYQLIGFYSVFQGVLLTAVAQSNLLHCNNTWTAILLSSLASFVTVIGVILKLRSIKELEHTIANEANTRQTLVTWQLSLWENGENFNFKDTVTNAEMNKKKELKDLKRLWWLNASFRAVKVVLILFSVAFVVSIRQILCNPGHDPYAGGS